MNIRLDSDPIRSPDAVYAHLMELGALFEIDMSAMKSCMLGLRHHLKIVRVVIGRVAVDMVNNLVAGQRPTNLHGSDKTMLCHIPSLACHWIVRGIHVHVSVPALCVPCSAFALSGLPITEASHRTKAVGTIGKALGAKLRAALFADEYAGRLGWLTDLREVGAFRRAESRLGKLVRNFGVGASASFALLDGARRHGFSRSARASAFSGAEASRASSARLHEKGCFTDFTRFRNGDTLRGHSDRLLLDGWGVVPRAVTAAPGLSCASILPQLRGIRGTEGRVAPCR